MKQSFGVRIKQGKTGVTKQKLTTGSRCVEQGHNFDWDNPHILFLERNYKKDRLKKLFITRNLIIIVTNNLKQISYQKYILIC